MGEASFRSLSGTHCTVMVSKVFSLTVVNFSYGNVKGTLRRKITNMFVMPELKIKQDVLVQVKTKYTGSFAILNLLLNH